MTEESSAGDTVVPPLLPPTNMLYMTYEGNWLMDCSAVVLDIQTDADASTTDAVMQVSLDRTVLHAQGGGQPTDTGTLTLKTLSADSISPTMTVQQVLLNRETGVATHTGKLNADLKVGDAVTVSCNTENRRILSECHTAGHVVDSAMAKAGKFMEASKAYHFLDGPYVEYIGSIPIEERAQVLQDLQAAFLELVEQDIPTEIQLLSKLMADKVCNRQAQNFDMDIFCDRRTERVRIVTVAGFPCPCGGTHVRSTADLKERAWGITGLKSKKGVVRVKYGQNTKREE